MSEDKTVFVDETTYNRIIEELGYKPENLVLNNYVPKNQAIVIDDDNLKTPLQANLGRTKY